MGSKDVQLYPILVLFYVDVCEVKHWNTRLRYVVFHVGTKLRLHF